MLLSSNLGDKTASHAWSLVAIPQSLEDPGVQDWDKEEILVASGRVPVFNFKRPYETRAG